LTETLSGVVAHLLRRPRYEVIPVAGAAEAVVEHVPTEVKVTVTASPTKGIDSTLELSERLAGHGYRVVPHLSARLVADEADLERILARLDEHGLREVFVVAGDLKKPAGEFEGAFELLSAMARVGHRLEEIGITGYPESHPFISDEETIRSMFAKEPLATYIVSQMSFNPETIGSWVERVRRRGTELPIHIGVPGAVDRKRLLRVSMQVGVGDSIRFLRKHGGRLRGLLAPGYSPDRLLEQLAPYAANGENRIAGLHVYTFNEVEQTEAWRQAALERARAAPLRP
jgi:methylenetetrahydrofolate reductase (NADPH)